MKETWLDIRTSVRGLLAPSNRLATWAAIAMLSLAIGAMTTLFSVAESVLVRQLPYPHADRLVRVQLTTEDRRGRVNDPLVATPWELFDRWQTATRSFEALGAVQVGSAVLSNPAGAERITRVALSANVFALLGVTPALGRSFSDDEDRPGGSRVVVLSHSFWESRLGGDRGAIGTILSMDGTPYTIVGVMPRGYRVPLSVAGVDENEGEVWIPFGLVRRPQRTAGSWPDMVGVIGRLQASVSAARAVAEVDAITNQHLDVVRNLQKLLARGRPPTSERELPRFAQVVSLHSVIVGDARRMILLLLAAVAGVIVIASANTATILLARAMERRHEFALRRALGAGAARIARQLIVEALTLTGTAAVFGLGLAHLAIRALSNLAGRVLPLVNGAALNVPVLLIALGAVVGVGFAAGAGPALVIARGKSRSALREGFAGHGRSRERQRLLDSLVVGQMVVALVLLASTGLLVQSFIKLAIASRGYATDGIAVVQIPIPDGRYDSPASQSALTARLLEKVSAIPGVVRAAAASGVPMLGGNTSLVEVPADRGSSVASRASIRTQVWAVTPDYFEVLGIPLRTGRRLGLMDSAAVVIDVAAASALFARGNPIGASVTWDRGARRGTVVGVVGNIDEIRRDQQEGQNRRVSPPHLYTVLGTEALFDVNVLVKMRGDASAVSGELRKAVASTDPSIPVEQAGALADFLAEPFARERLMAAVVIAFGVLAIAITATGIYAVVAYGAARRTREMGIRLALGARTFDILALGMRRTLFLAGAGAAIGVVSAIGTTRWLGHYLFEVSPVQPAALAGAVIVMLGAAVVASGVPAYRATRVDPTTSLRRD